MEHDAPALFVALEQSALGAAIRQSVWLYPFANIGHVVVLFVFAGAITVMDLRLMGALSAAAPGPLIGRARRVAMIAFAGMVLTGAMLFTAEAGHIIQNPVFLVKLALIAVGLANVAIYQFAVAERVAPLPAGAPMPSAARLTGAVSLGAWLLVAACGRTIAYF